MDKPFAWLLAAVVAVLGVLTAVCCGGAFLFVASVARNAAMVAEQNKRQAISDVEFEALAAAEIREAIKAHVGHEFAFDVIVMLNKRDGTWTARGMAKPVGSKASAPWSASIDSTNKQSPKVVFLTYGRDRSVIVGEHPKSPPPK